MRWILGVLGGLALATPLAAQVSIGEFQLTAGGAAALRPTSHAPADFPPPGGRALAGLTASFSFVHRSLSLGPEAMVFRGSDRRMYSLGGVSRLRLAEGRVRPYILIGAGFYSWDRKQIPAFDPGLGAVWTGDKTYFTGSAGAGLIVGLGRLAFVVEGRGHKSLQNNSFFGPRDAVSLSLGGRLSW